MPLLTWHSHADAWLGCDTVQIRAVQSGGFLPRHFIGPHFERSRYVAFCAQFRQG